MIPHPSAIQQLDFSDVLFVQIGQGDKPEEEVYG